MVRQKQQNDEKMAIFSLIHHFTSYKNIQNIQILESSPTLYEKISHIIS